jgi:hypothetical protein
MLAPSLRSWLFHSLIRVEWTPYSLDSSLSVLVALAASNLTRHSKNGRIDELAERLGALGCLKGHFELELGTMSLSSGHEIDLHMWLTLISLDKAHECCIKPLVNDCCVTLGTFLSA